jgi:hypothetical protein
MLFGFVVDANDFIGKILFPGKKKVVVGKEDKITDMEADKILDDIQRFGWKFAKE